MSENTKTLVQKLEAIQKNLIAPKNQYNSFGKYKYRNCEDILQAVKPWLDGCVVLLDDEMIFLGEDRVYLKSTASISDGISTLKATSFAREPLSKKGMDESQVTGAASSYARKYALNALFMIDDTKDSDSRSPEEGASKKSAQPPAETEEIKSKIIDKQLMYEEQLVNCATLQDLKNIYSAAYVEFSNLANKSKTAKMCLTAIEDLKNKVKDKITASEKAAKE